MFKMAAGRDSMRDPRSIRDLVPPDLLRAAAADLRGARGQSVESRPTRVYLRQERLRRRHLRRRLGRRSPLRPHAFPWLWVIITSSSSSS